MVRRLLDSATPATMFVLRSQEDGPLLTPAPGIPVVFAVRRRMALRWAVLVGAGPLVRESRRHDILVSSSEIGFVLLMGWIVAKVVRKPFVVLVQSPLGEAIGAWVPKPLQGVTRKVNASVDAAICVSAGLAREIVDNGLPADRVFTVPIGVDIDRVVECAQQPSSVATPTGCYIVAAGRLDVQKGFDVLIRAHAHVVKAGTAHTLVIVGEGDDRAALTELARSLEVADSVEMPGFVDNPHPLIAQADLFVLSSRREGMGGLVLLEALAHATPIIATDCTSGPRELLDDGRLGQLVPVDDVDAMATAILAHFADSTVLRRRASGGPLRVHDFDPDTSAAAVTKILRQVVDERGERTARRPGRSLLAAPDAPWKSCG